MIARIPIVLQPRFEEAWQKSLANGLTNCTELFDVLGIPVARRPTIAAADGTFPLRVPRGFIARMRKGDPDDPLLRQVLPLAAERMDSPGYHDDPVGDHLALKGPGLLHKYHGRALLVTTGACAIHCRYCFRRHFPYQQQHARHNNWEDVIGALGQDTSIREVILSGGDPLLLTTPHLRSLTEQLQTLAHIKRLRLHSRLPIVLPERINTGLIDWLGDLSLQTILVIHANHPAEIDRSVSSHLARLRNLPITLLNQSVLLRGVNDDGAALAALSERLFEVGVLPYYLHQLDRVRGAAHFEISDDTALALHKQLEERLPGYLVPRLVYEQAGAASKLSLTRRQSL
jgi:EF-P beta-lysylation protein EpmB